MEDLPLGRIAALVPEFAVNDLPLGRTHDDDDEQVAKGGYITLIPKLKGGLQCGSSQEKILQQK